MGRDSFVQPGMQGARAASLIGQAVTPPVDVEPAPLRYFAGSLALLVMGAGLLGLAAWFVTNEELAGGAPFVAVPGLVMAAAGVALLVRRARTRGRLTVHERGLVLERSGGSSVVAFDETTNLTLVEQHLLNNGVVAGMRRRLRLISPGATVTIDQVALADRPDPVGPAIAEALDRATDRLEIRLAAGSRLEGKGWTLDRAGITVGARQVVPIASIGRAGTFESQVRLWRGAEDEPFLAVPESSPNAALLLRLALRSLEGRPPAETPTSTLGRVLFRKATGRTAVAVGILLGLVLAAVGAGLLVGGVDRIWGVGVGLAGLGVVAGVAWAWGSRFECRERGVLKRTLLGERSLRYEEVETLAYSATRTYHNGIYTGTTLAIRFVAGDGRKLGMSTTVRGVDDDLDELRDHVARVVAARLDERLQVGQHVPWGKGAWLTPDGIRFRARKLVGSGPEETLPYGPHLRYALQDGSLTLFDGPDPKPRRLFTVACSEDNFFPGFLVFNARSGPADDAPTDTA